MFDYYNSIPGFEEIDPSHPAMKNYGGGAWVETEAAKAAKDAVQRGEDFELETGTLLYLRVYPAGIDQPMFNNGGSLPTCRMAKR